MAGGVATQLVKERDSIPTNAVCGVSLNNATAETGTIDMKNFFRATFIGVLGAGAVGTIAAYLQESANANGVGGTNIAGTAVTSIVNGAANSTFTMEVCATQLTQRYVKGVIVESQVIARNVSLVGIGTGARFSPANSFDSNTVLQRTVANA